MINIQHYPLIYSSHSFILKQINVREHILQNTTTNLIIAKIRIHPFTCSINYIILQRERFSAEVSIIYLSFSCEMKIQE